MKKKLIIGSILIILAVALVPLLFHPVWFTAEENIVCSKYDNGYDIEYLEGLENDESMLKNNDTEKMVFQSKMVGIIDNCGLSLMFMIPHF